ncbi:mechanosensitive ion channel family protein [Bacillaceae bacterium Marseille-Q3522]|nr:mechanosensitive ion channel family protein [Bacillaceae bacterium Marseille-Q3522]
MQFDFEFYKNIAISIGILLLFLVFRKIFTKYVFRLILHYSKKSSSNIFTHICQSFEKPIRWLFVVIGVYLALLYYPDFHYSTFPIVGKIISSILIFLISWGLFNFSSASSVIFLKLKDRFDIDFDRILIPFLSKGIQFIIVAISFSVIADQFGFNVSSFVAGLGLGGLAFALAAKDFVGNFFGGIVIITEKPFSIGDWIRTSNVEGIVEDITFRSTKVRTFEQSLVTVPNSILSNEAITNWSKMGKRRVILRLDIAFDTPRYQIEQTVSAIKTYLKNHTGIHQDAIMVTFDQITAGSIEIFIQYFTVTTVWEEYLNIKQEVNYKILEIFEQENVEISVPTQIIQLANSLGMENKVISQKEGN